MRGKRANVEDIYLKIEWVDPTTPEGKESWDNGFRILAHMIAKAYLKDQNSETQLAGCYLSSRLIQQPDPNVQV